MQTIGFVVHFFCVLLIWGGFYENLTSRNRYIKRLKISNLFAPWVKCHWWRKFLSSLFKLCNVDNFLYIHALPLILWGHPRCTWYDPPKQFFFNMKSIHNFLPFNILGIFNSYKITAISLFSLQLKCHTFKASNILKNICLCYK